MAGMRMNLAEADQGSSRGRPTGSGLRPTAADGGRRAPLAALFILLGLLLGSGPAAAARSDPGDHVPRLGSDRHGATAPLVRSSQREAVPDDADGPETHPFDGARVPHVVTLSPATRPGGAGSAETPSARAEAPPASYRARAPPAA